MAKNIYCKNLTSSVTYLFHDVRSQMAIPQQTHNGENAQMSYHTTNKIFHHN